MRLFTLFMIAFVISSLILVSVALATASASPVGETQPVTRPIQRPAPPSLEAEVPNDCIDDCIDWNAVLTPKPGKVVCFTTQSKAKKRVYTGRRNGKKWKLVVSTVNAKRVCREVRL